jgi:hypothetical protein
MSGTTKTKNPTTIFLVRMFTSVSVIKIVLIYFKNYFISHGISLPDSLMVYSFLFSMLVALLINC